jgi:hypothetical protein
MTAAPAKLNLIQMSKLHEGFWSSNTCSTHKTKQIYSQNCISICSYNI